MQKKSNNFIFSQNDLNIPMTSVPGFTLTFLPAKICQSKLSFPIQIACDPWGRGSLGVRAVHSVCLEQFYHATHLYYEFNLPYSGFCKYPYVFLFCFFSSRQFSYFPQSLFCDLISYLNSLLSSSICQSKLIACFPN